MLCAKSLGNRPGIIHAGSRERTIFLSQDHIKSIRHRFSFHNSSFDLNLSDSDVIYGKYLDYICIDYFTMGDSVNHNTYQ